MECNSKPFGLPFRGFCLQIFQVAIQAANLAKDIELFTVEVIKTLYLCGFSV